MEGEQNKADGECLGVTFYVNEHWKFVVPDLGRTFKSYEDMLAAIEAAEKRIKSAKRVKLALSVVSDQLESLIVKGVHAGHGDILFAKQPTLEGVYGGTHVYVDSPWILKAIQERNDLQARVNEIERVVGRFRILNKQGGKSYRSDRLDVQGDGTNEGLQAVYDALVKKANATSLEKELKIKSKEDE